MPDKAIDLMDDEAAAKLRVALHTLPTELKALKAELDKLKSEEEAHTVRDYERAATCRADRLRVEGEFREMYDAWQAENSLDWSSTA